MWSQNAYNKYTKARKNDLNSFRLSMALYDIACTVLLWRIKTLSIVETDNRKVLICIHAFID